MAMILVYVEHRQGTLRKVALECLSEGRRIADQLKVDLAAFLIGHRISDLVGTLAGHGADVIYMLDEPACEVYNTETHASLLAGFIREEMPRIVLMGHTTTGKDLGPRVAEMVGAGMVSDCVNISTSHNEIRYTRPIFGGRLLAQVTVETPIHIVSIRPNLFTVGKTEGRGETRQWKASPAPGRALVEKVEVTANSRPELTEAEIIVSGGRGLGGAEGFELLGQLADRLGGAVGASRAAVDSGWAPHALQVGQTGKVVNPSVYIACGISGAIQHLAGMRSSRLIIAINKDPDALIFKSADLGLVLDLYEAVPEIIRQREQRREKNKKA